MKPKCSIALGWTDPDGCGRPAIARNKFSCFECAEHHSMPRNTQPDSFFKNGVLFEEIDGSSFLGMVKLYVAYGFYSMFDIKLWKKNT